MTLNNKIECVCLLASPSLASGEEAHSELHGPPAAKSDLMQGNIFFPKTLPLV